MMHLFGAVAYFFAQHWCKKISKKMATSKINVANVVLNCMQF